MGQQVVRFALAPLMFHPKEAAPASPNSSFTLTPPLRSSFGLSATSSLVTPLAERQKRKRRALTAGS